MEFSLISVTGMTVLEALVLLIVAMTVFELWIGKRHLQQEKK